MSKYSYIHLYMIWLQTGTDNFVPQDSGMIVSCCFLGFIHLIPPLTRDLSQESSFCAFLPPDVLLICLWFFTPPPTHVLLTYLWFGSEIDVGWNDTHFTAPENKAKNFWEKRRVHENESLVALQVSPESDSSGLICSRETLNRSSLAEKPPQSVFHS